MGGDRDEGKQQKRRVPLSDARSRVLNVSGAGIDLPDTAADGKVSLKKTAVGGGGGSSRGRGAIHSTAAWPANPGGGRDPTFSSLRSRAKSRSRSVSRGASRGRSGAPPPTSSLDPAAD